MCSCSDVLVASGVALAHATRSEPVRMQPVANPSDMGASTWRRVPWGGGERSRLAAILENLLGCARAWMCWGWGKRETTEHRPAVAQSPIRRSVQRRGMRTPVARVVHVHNAYYWRTLKTNSNYERLFTYALPSHSPLTLPGRSPTRLEAACRCGQEKVAAPSLRPWPANDPPRVPRGC